MPSITFMRDLVEEARKEAERTALLVAMNCVDLMLEHSSTLDEFVERWGNAKALYQEMNVD
jgi:hypothetical protein